jgi:hypothetical protein
MGVLNFVCIRERDWGKTDFSNFPTSLISEKRRFWEKSNTRSGAKKRTNSAETDKS